MSWLFCLILRERETERQRDRETERERGRERDRGREREREGEREIFALGPGFFALEPIKHFDFF